MKRLAFHLLFSMLPVYVWCNQTTIDGITYTYQEYSSQNYGIGRNPGPNETSISDYFKICLLTDIKGNVPERLIIPDSIDGYIVTGIACSSSDENAYKDLAAVKHLELPLFCRVVYDNIFPRCPNLESVVLESHIQFISLSAFENCNNLRSITCYSVTPPPFLWYFHYENGMSIMDYDKSSRLLFNDIVCKNATLYVRPGCKEAYKESVFGNLQNIEEMDLPGFRNGDEIKSYVDGILYTYTVLSVTDKTCLLGKIVPNTVIRWPEEWSGLDPRNDPDWIAVDLNTKGIVEIPSKIDGFTVTELGYSCLRHDNHIYQYQPQISEVILPNTVKKIWGYMVDLQQNDNLTIPASVEYIGPFFANPSHIFVDTSNPVFDSRNNCNAIIHTSSNTLIKGSSYTIIPDDVVAIGDYAMWKNNMGHVNYNGLKYYAELPKSVKTFGKGAFYGCKFLGNVLISKIEEPTAISNVFDETTLKSVTLYVPNGKLSVYQSTSGWNEFKNIKEMNDLSTGIGVSVVDDGTNIPVSIYSPNGIKPNSTVDGLNVIQMKNGEARKVIIK